MTVEDNAVSFTAICNEAFELLKAEMKDQPGYKTELTDSAPFHQQMQEGGSYSVAGKSMTVSITEAVCRIGFFHHAEGGGLFIGAKRGSGYIGGVGVPVEAWTAKQLSDTAKKLLSIKSINAINAILNELASNKAK